MWRSIKVCTGGSIRYAQGWRQAPAGLYQLQSSLGSFSGRQVSRHSSLHCSRLSLRKRLQMSQESQGACTVSTVTAFLTHHICLTSLLHS